jgi:peptidoglycan/LPS O-acetylase OafA/YrhL
MQRFTALDGLRGVCAVTVMLFHMLNMFSPGNKFHHGYLAVDVFFILSGFVIVHTYDRRLAGGMTPLQFMKHRVERLLPVYWAGGALCVATYLLYRLMPAGTGAPVLTLVVLMSLFLIPQTLIEDTFFPTNTFAWSLFVEYVVNALYATLRPLLKTPVLIAAMAAAWIYVTVRVELSPTDAWAGGGLIGTMDIAIGRGIGGFACGMLLYRAYCRGWFERLPRIDPRLLLTTWFAATVMPAASAPHFYDQMVVIFYAPLLVALLVCSEDRTPSWVKTLGLISYPLYASQGCILNAVTALKPEPSFALGLVIAAACFALAYAIARANIVWQGWYGRMTAGKILANQPR